MVFDCSYITGEGETQGMHRLYNKAFTQIHRRSSLNSVHAGEDLGLEKGYGTL